MAQAKRLFLHHVALQEEVGKTKLAVHSDAGNLNEPTNVRSRQAGRGHFFLFISNNIDEVDE